MKLDTLTPPHRLPEKSEGFLGLPLFKRLSTIQATPEPQDYCTRLILNGCRRCSREFGAFLPNSIYTGDGLALLPLFQFVCLWLCFIALCEVI
ncbi:hypothetical protein PAAG_06276 [Paracoccidioides lutzii Pb01]|uniref:Uncharacterized protein n=1 Tax=Paracoccidioides lutzii (strain ATCC MYA-826 / Pb01) TaxID=502779 RepID=C1H5T1_PARBA|nr:hypothetical protein PAAG_06276 [Paracoccidioides lutzii Pb01]EEH35229.2 hypothetical protein PAAG_06276 [Paracoccidioides lutzii Pb01]